MRTATRPLAAALVLLALFAGGAAADALTCPGNTPVPNGAVIVLRVFNDCPSSVVTAVNLYPDTISIMDAENDCFGFANLHGWNFSADGGTTPALFENCSTFSYSADVVLAGSGGGEGGLRISPWWNAPLYAVDGRFMLNATTGEIACFGGRLPFFSFTNAFGLHYEKGTQAHMAIAYAPHDLSEANPATITYTLGYHDSTFTSGPLPFDQGNPNEVAEHGQWGLLNASGVGGYVQALVGAGTAVSFAATWTDIRFQGPAVVEDSDQDGVPDQNDQCAGTPAGSIVDSTGCSLEQLVPCEGPRAGGTWRNHGQYVSTLARTAERFVRAGLFTEFQKDSIVAFHAASACGKSDRHPMVIGRMHDPRGGGIRSVQLVLPQSGQVRLTVVDVAGRRVRELVNGFQPGGTFTVDWDASGLRSGVYFYALRAGGEQVTERFVVWR